MRPRGFSLLEVMVALTIVAVVFTLVFHGISGSLKTLDRVEQFDRRLELVQSKLAELDLCETMRAGDHAEGVWDDGTRWRADVSNFVPPTESNPASVVRIVLGVEWQGRSEPQRRAITTYRFVAAPRRDELIPSLEDQLRDLR